MELLAAMLANLLLASSFHQISLDFLSLSLRLYLKYPQFFGFVIRFRVGILLLLLRLQTIVAKEETTLFPLHKAKYAQSMHPDKI